jgi:hypothetical protein
MSDDPTGPTAWEKANKGRAVRAFAAARDHDRPAERPRMIEQSAHKPTGPVPSLKPRGEIQVLVDNAVASENAARLARKQMGLGAFRAEKPRADHSKDVTLKHEFNKSGGHGR